jgi:putative tryptophan/tyrosine transport system substrate-binding protein
MQPDQVKRRNFVTLLGSAAAMWPLVARAAAGKSSQNRLFDPGQAVPIDAQIIEALRQFGWIEGKNGLFEIRLGTARMTLTGSLECPQPAKA